MPLVETVDRNSRPAADTSKGVPTALTSSDTQNLLNLAKRIWWNNRISSCFQIFYCIIFGEGRGNKRKGGRGGSKVEEEEGEKGERRG